MGAKAVRYTGGILSSARKTLIQLGIPRHVPIPSRILRSFVVSAGIWDSWCPHHSHWPRFGFFRWNLPYNGFRVVVI